MAPSNEVLVVEDEKITAIEIRNQVESLGYRVSHVVATGEGALKVAETQHFSLVLMDVSLAGKLDGVETTRRLRRIQDAPVIFLTGHSDEQFVSVAKEAGAFGYVLKPIRGRELAIAIEFAVYKHEGERTLRYERDRAERAMAAKSEFLANMSHELRTPLNSIIGMADLSLERATDPEQKSYLSILKSSGDALMVLINGILDLSKIEAGMMQVEHKPFALLDVVEGSLEAIAVQAHQKGLSVELDADPEIPSWTNGDAGKIRQILLNLLANAVKYTTTGSVTCFVSAKGKELVLAVKDTGMGIPAEALEEVFAPFFQTDQTSTRRHAGTGIGLTITKKLVELMEGEVRVSSEVGVGSCFTVSLPLTPAGSDAQSTDQSRRPSVRRVYVDLKSEAHNRLVSRWLPKWGVEVRRFVSEGDGFGHAASEGDTAILLDEESAESRGDVSGAYVLRRFRRRNGNHNLGITLFEPLTVTKLTEVIGISSGPAQVVESGGVSDLSVGTFRDPSHASSTSEGPREDGETALRILLADDDRINRVANSHLLKSLGHDVVAVEDGRAAIDALEDAAPDLIILDLEMPRLDGYQTASEIKTGSAGVDYASLPVLALSAHTSREARSKAYRSGFVGFLVKPFSREELQEIVRAAVDPTRRRENLLRHFVEECRLLFDDQSYEELETTARSARRSLKQCDPETANWFLRLALAARRSDSATSRTLIQELKDHALTAG